MIENIFTEFMSLYYTEPGKLSGNLKDIKIDSNAVMRIYENNYTINFITNGNKVRISWEWIDMFSSLNVYSGNRILHTKPNGAIESFIFKFIELIDSFYNNPESNFLNIFSDICKYKTKTFRNWMESKFNKTLYPFEFISPNENFTI